MRRWPRDRRRIATPVTAVKFCLSSPYFYLISNFFTYRFGTMFLKSIKKLFGKKSLKSRYAKKTVNPNFYGTISVSGITGEISTSFTGDYWPDLDKSIFKRVLLIEKCKKRNWRNDPIILGTKGITHMEPGYIFAPYVPMFEIPEIIPISNRVQAITLAQELVPIQPMSLPTGLISFIDYNFYESENRKLLKEKIKISKYER